MKLKKAAKMSKDDLVEELLLSSIPEDDFMGFPVCDYSRLKASQKAAHLGRKLAIAKELLLRDLLEKMIDRPFLFRSPSHARDWLRLHYANVEREIFLLAHLNVQHRLIDVEEFSVGTLSESTVYPRELLKSVLSRNSGAVIFVHNHVGGSTEPSAADIRLTVGMKEVLAHAKVALIDHLIVSGYHITSLAELGYCDEVAA